MIDTHAALGLAESDLPPSRAVITVVDGHHYAILVDALEDVAPFPRAALPGGIAVDGGWARAGCGIVNRDGDPILAIDLRALIPGQLVAA